MKASAVLNNFYNGNKNFITPNVLDTGWIGDSIVYEVSSGSGINPGTTIWGLTVLEKDEDGSWKRSKSSGCHHSLGSVSRALYALGGPGENFHTIRHD